MYFLMLIELEYQNKIRMNQREKIHSCFLLLYILKLINAKKFNFKHNNINYMVKYGTT